MLEQPVPKRLHPMRRTHAGAVHQELQSVGRTRVVEACGGLSLVGGTPCWSVRSPILRSKEQQRQRVMN